MSTEDQARGESPRNHEMRARMYAKLKGWEVVEVYDLSGVSGKSVLEHPEARKMLQDVASGRINALIFSKLARLARNVKDLLEISEHFQKHGANLVSLEESIDTGNPAGRLLFTVIGALAQWEREEISSRVAASIPIRAMQGKPTGGQGPFGYCWKDKQLVPHPEESLVVKEIYMTFLKTKKILTTARIINQKGYRTRRGAQFGTTTIKRILTDTVYRGLKRANYSRSRGDKKSWVLKPESEWIYFQVEPIVDEKTWEEVNEIIRKNSEPFPKLPPSVYQARYAFSGLVFCECGGKMYVMKYPGMRVPRYRCRRCNSKINEDILLDKFREGLRYIVIKPEQLQESVKVDERVIEDRQNQIELLKRELRSVRSKIDRLLDLWAEGEIGRDVLSERIQNLQERKTQLEEEISWLEGEIYFLRVAEMGREHLITKATTLYSLWDELNSESQREVIKEILSSVKVKKDVLEYEFYHLPELMPLCKSGHTPEDLDTFTKYGKYHLVMSRPQEFPEGYPSEPQTLGEHIRKKRIDMGFTQEEVASMLGVDTATLRNWEWGRSEPSVRYYPTIIDFLGYIPFELPEGDDILVEIERFRLVNGYTYRELGRMLKVDETQLRMWLKGQHKPTAANRQRLRKRLTAVFSSYRECQQVTGG